MVFRHVQISPGGRSVYMHLLILDVIFFVEMLTNHASRSWGG